MAGVPAAGGRERCRLPWQPIRTGTLDTGSTAIRRPPRSVAAAVTAVLVVGGAGSAWAWSEHEDRVAAEQASAQDRVADTVAAQVHDADALQLQDAHSARVEAAAVRADARTALATAAERARSTLATTEGAVADDAVRQSLATVLATADEALAATDPAGAGSAADPAAAGTASDPAPVAPVAQAAGPALAARHSAVALRALAASLTAADAAVVAAHDAWQQETAAAAARAAAAAAAAAAKPTAKAPTATAPKAGSAPAAPSCGTTYSGPPFYTSPPTAGGDGSNGKLPPEALTAISWDVDPHGTPYYLTTSAAAALERLNGAFRAAFGHNLDLDLTYRDYDTQVAMRAALGTVAATPGTSSHGTGLALDVPELPCEYGWDTPQRTWLVTKGPSYGWVSPSWAGRGGSNPEYWHFEYRG